MAIKHIQITHKDLVDNTSNGVVATDLEGRIVMFNRQAVEILKKGDELREGKVVADVLTQSGPLIKTCLATGESQLGIHVHGRNVSLVANITPIYRDGSMIGSMSNFQPMAQFEDSATRLDS